MGEPEFEEIMKLFPPEVFDSEFAEQAITHFRALADKAKNGTADEQAEAREELATYEKGRDIIRKELADQLNMNESDISRIISNEQNYSKDEWERMQDATEQMEPVMETAQKPKKKKKSKKPKGWVKS